MRLDPRNPPAKQRALEALVARVRADHAEALRSQLAARHGATHSETRAEGPKDTRSTEASYLARGLAERVESLSATLAVLETFRPGAFAEDDAIGVGACVVLENDEGQASAYLIVPVGGGESLEVEGLRIRTLTPGTPLGRRLLGRKRGDRVPAPSPRGERELAVVALS